MGFWASIGEVSRKVQTLSPSKSVQNSAQTFLYGANFFGL